MTPPARLPAWSLFAALIAMAGLPIYIHAPKFFVDEYGVSLAALGFVLAGLRLIDVVQDPLLGWLAEATRPRRRLGVALAVYEAVLPFVPNPADLALKWPNDLMLGGAKLAGAGTGASTDGAGSAVNRVHSKASRMATASSRAKAIRPPSPPSSCQN